MIIKSFKDKSTQISPLLESKAWAITNLVANQRATEPTNDTLAKRSKEGRQSETLTVSPPSFMGQIRVTYHLLCGTPSPLVVIHSKLPF